MSLKQWESNGWLKAEPTGQQEIKNLLAIAERDLKDATGSISPDSATLPALRAWTDPR